MCWNGFDFVVYGFFAVTISRFIEGGFGSMPACNVSAVMIGLPGAVAGYAASSLIS
jgi:hypothetical protein